MRNILLVIKHEIRTTIGKRSFWIMTFMFPVLIVALSFGSQLLAEKSFANEEEAGVLRSEVAGITGLVDEAGLILHLPPDVPAKLLQTFPNQASAQIALEANELDRYYLIPEDFRQTGEVILVVSDYSPIANLSSNTLFGYIIDANLIGDDALARLMIDPSPNEVFYPQAVDVQAEGDNGVTSFLVPYTTMMLFFMLISMTGNMMLTSVTKEKENRTMEVLLLSLRPRELMAGKLLGLGIVALLQMSIWLGGGLLAQGGGGQVLRSSLAALTPSFVLWALAYLMFGYLLYASILGALGSLAPTAREGAQFSFLVMLPLFIPLALNTIFVESPHGGLATFLSLFPLSAPTSMVTRLVSDAVPAWQPIVGLVGLAVTTFFFISLAARFFRADTLLSSASLTRQRLLGALLGKENQEGRPSRLR